MSKSASLRPSPLRIAWRLRPASAAAALQATLPAAIDSLVFDPEDWLRSGWGAQQCAEQIGAGRRYLYTIGGLQSLGGSGPLATGWQETIARLQRRLRCQGHIEHLGIRAAAGLHAGLSLPLSWRAGVARHLAGRLVRAEAEALLYPVGALSLAAPAAELQRLRRVLGAGGWPLCVDLSQIWATCQNLGGGFRDCIDELLQAAPAMVLVSGAQCGGRDLLRGGRDPWLRSPQGPVPEAVREAALELRAGGKPPRMWIFDLCEEEGVGPRLPCLTAWIGALG